MAGRTLRLLIVVYVATRALGVFLAINPEVYGTSHSKVTYDPVLYGGWAVEMLDDDLFPYSGVAIEYPPGVLPFVVAPEIERPLKDTYLVRFVVTMLVVDLAAFIGVLIIGKRWGSSLGPWLWIGGVTLLGPIAFTRLDLIPAMATIWAIERASARSWFGAGGWMVFGALSKVYPMFLMPLMYVASSAKRRFVMGISVISVLILMPYLGALAPLYDSVFGFHSSRGVHVESTWGAALIGATYAGYEAAIELNYGAFHVESGLSGLLKNLGNFLALVAVGIGMWVAATSFKRDDIPKLAATMYGTLAVIMGVGTVFSPQFILWLIALGAVTLCHPSRTLRGPILTMLPIAFITQVIYPWVYELLLSANASSIAVLISRNALVLISGLGTWAAIRGERFGPSQPQLVEGPVAPSAALATV
ncbi:MAG TPA: hypothetical protein VNC78_04990 [Actinomycetota bacterium]|nr:hypothetical protein [Actinomycetota bacterium]